MDNPYGLPDDHWYARLLAQGDEPLAEPDRLAPQTFKRLRLRPRKAEATEGENA